MTNYLWYLIGANLVMAVLFGVFRMVQAYLSFGWQRFSLLGIPLLSVLVVCAWQWPAAERWSYDIPVFVLESIQIQSTQASGGFNLSPFEIVYWLGVIIFTAWMLFSLYKTLRILLKNGSKREDGFTIVELTDREPFSFFRLIQLPAGLAEQDRLIILEHEKIHARKLHSADRLFFESMHCMAWFNPVILLMKRELVHIHEFEVDRLMYHKYRTSYTEFLVAYALGTSSSIYLFTNQFLTKLTLIKRIKKMKNTSKKAGIAAFVLPLVAGALTLVSFTAENTLTPNPSREQVANKVQEAEVNKMPEFVGGMSALTEYMIKNVHYPESAEKAKVTGNVLVSFVVTEEGKVTQVKVKKGAGDDLDNEAKRVVSSMPDWIPAEKAGKKVAAELVLPVSFKL